jgi:hypothetical protein
MKRPTDTTSTVIIAAAAVLAAGITLYQLTRPTQPPGFALLASPFAFLSEPIGTRDALAVLRLCTPLRMCCSSGRWCATTGAPPSSSRAR